MSPDITDRATPARVTEHSLIRCDRHPDRLATRYLPKTRERLCDECRARPAIPATLTAGESAGVPAVVAHPRVTAGRREANL